MPDHPKALEVRQVLAAALLEQGRPEEAIAILRDLLDRQRAIYVTGDVRISTSQALLGAALQRIGKAEETLRLGAEAGDLLTHSSGPALLYRAIYRPVLEEMKW